MEQAKHPKKWKFALLVWCFVYPAITLLSIYLIPYIIDYHPMLRTLILTLILVPLMAFFYIPFINKRFSEWLRK